MTVPEPVEKVDIPVPARMAVDPPPTELIVRLAPGLYDRLILAPARIGIEPAVL